MVDGSFRFPVVFWLFVLFFPQPAYRVPLGVRAADRALGLRSQIPASEQCPPGVMDDPRQATGREGRGTGQVRPKSLQRRCSELVSFPAGRTTSRRGGPHGGATATRQAGRETDAAAGRVVFGCGDSRPDLRGSYTLNQGRRIGQGRPMSPSPRMPRNRSVQTRDLHTPSHGRRIGQRCPAFSSNSHE